MQLVLLKSVYDVRFRRVTIGIAGISFGSNLKILLKTRPLSTLGVHLEIAGLCQFLPQPLYLFPEGLEILRVVLVDLHLHL
jgi:hypothetical protein